MLVSLQLLNLRQAVGLLGWGISPSQGHSLILIYRREPKVVGFEVFRAMTMKSTFL
jgi:hypothetical protein